MLFRNAVSVMCCFAVRLVSCAVLQCGLCHVRFRIAVSVVFCFSMGLVSCAVLRLVSGACWQYIQISKNVVYSKVRGHQHKKRRLTIHQPKAVNSKAKMPLVIVLLGVMLQVDFHETAIIFVDSLPKLHVIGQL